MRTLLLHVGDDAVRAIVVEAVPGGWFEVVAQHRVVLGLGRAIRRDGQLGEGRRELVEETVRRLREAAFRRGVDRTVATVTPALAGAADLEALLEGCTEVAGVEVVLRDPGEQAFGLIVAAARALGRQALCPVLELSDSQLRWCGTIDGQTFEGNVAGGIDLLLTEHPDPLTAAGRAAAARTVAELLRCPGVVALLPEVPEGRPLVACGPAVVSLAETVLTRRWGGQRPHVEGTHVTGEDLRQLQHAVADAGPGGRLLLPEVDPAEGDRVTLAVLILHELTDRVGADGVVVTTADRHDAEVLAALELLSGAAPLDALSLAAGPSLVGCDAFAVRLFDALRDRFGLSDVDRDLLARSLSLPGSNLPSAHRRQARELLEQGVRGLDPDRLVELACLVRFRRGRLPGTHFSPYVRLPRIRRRVVERLVGMLRLAVALDAVVEADACAVALVDDGVVITVPEDRASSLSRHWLGGIERLLGSPVLLVQSPAGVAH